MKHKLLNRKYEKFNTISVMCHTVLLMCRLHHPFYRILTLSRFADLLKEVHDQKVQLDNLQHVKYQLAQQLEEARRRLEDAERERSQMQAQLHQVQLELDAVRTALDEESAARAVNVYRLIFRLYEFVIHKNTIHLV